MSELLELERSSDAGSETPVAHTRIAIVGSGFSGLGTAIRLKQAGDGDFVVLERRAGVGGTWWDNTYPGCQCDVPSNLYSFSFALNPAWSRTFSHQAEIRAYLRRCADRFGIGPHIRLDEELLDAAWDEEAGIWRLETARGRRTADLLVLGTGGLSEPSTPAIAGLEGFRGKVFHSAAWDHEHSLEGERVAVIGTGASAVQFIPRIQEHVERMHVFQRTAPWVMPHPDRPTNPLERRLFGSVPLAQRLMRTAIFWARETFVLAFMHPRLMGIGERIARRHLKRQVPDPELREKLRPRYRMGCKRVLLSNDYFPTLAEPNVDLVTDAISEVRPGSIATADGVERDVDTIILGTGFHVTDSPMLERVRGRDGRSLAETWRGSPNAHLGTTVTGFPNAFVLLGPNTGLGHNSVVFMIEAQIGYVLDCIRTMEERGAATVEARAEAQRASNDSIDRRLAGSVWNSGGCASWYLDASGRNATIWPGASWRFRQRTRRFDLGAHELRERPRERAPAP